METCTSLNVDVKWVAGRSPSPTRRKGGGETLLCCPVWVVGLRLMPSGCRLKLLSAVRANRQCAVPPKVLRK